MATAQRYSTVAAFERMEQGLCPECGREPDVHSMERDFWIRPGWSSGSCDLLPHGVRERIEQWQADQTS